jgi:DNA-binding Lrp family transcriptional regulator
LVELSGESVLFLRVRPGEVERALGDLKENPSVKGAEPTLGPYDIVVTAAFPDDVALRTFAAEMEAKEYCEGCAVRPSFRQWVREGAEEKPVNAWTLIHARNTEKTMRALQNVPAVNRVYEIPGEFNMVANLAVDDPAKLMDTLTRDVHRIEGIRRTETLTAIRKPEPPQP